MGNAENHKKPWSKKDLAALEYYRNIGIPTKVIARILDRSINSILHVSVDKLNLRMRSENGTTKEREFKLNVTLQPDLTKMMQEVARKYRMPETIIARIILYDFIRRGSNLDKCLEVCYDNNVDGDDNDGSDPNST